MSYTLHYSSSRTEIWQWYWRTWKKGLWRVHVVVAGFVGVILIGGAHFEAAHFGTWLAYSMFAFPIVVACFAIFPQFRFKSEERILQVGPDGWTSQIGTISGSRTWPEVAAVNDEAGAVVIRGTNGNALIIPEGAFVSNEQRQQFIKDIQEWRGKIG